MAESHSSSEKRDATEPQKVDTQGEWEFAGVVGVDGAHIMVADPNYAGEFSKEWIARTGKHYDQTVVNGIARLGKMGDATAVVAGDGDGCYRVFVRRGKTEIEGCDHDINVRADSSSRQSVLGDFFDLPRVFHTRPAHKVEPKGVTLGGDFELHGRVVLHEPLTFVDFKLPVTEHHEEVGG